MLIAVSKFSLPVLILAVLVTGCAPKKDSATPSSPQAEPMATVACTTQMQEKFATMRATQDAWYVDHKSPAPTEIDKAQLSIGNNGRAVMLVHGFIASPAAMQDLADVLTKSGDTVLRPLMTGFGSDANAANSSTADDWEQSVSEGMALLKSCYPNVTVVAHSLGGAVVTEEIAHHNLQGINGLVFLSPYYKLAKSWLATVSNALANKVDEIDVPTLHRLTGIDPYSYLPITRPLPGEPEPFLPLHALSRVIQLQADFENEPATQNAIPLLLAVSEADPVIDGSYALQYLTGFFKSLEKLVYPSDENVGHSIECRATNPYFDVLADRIQGEILKD